MKRLLLVLVSLALVVSGCAVGEPKPPTAPSATGITLNANIYSSISGPTDYWFTYRQPGTANWSDTTHRTATLTASTDSDRHPQAVSEPITGLQPNTSYDWQICAADRQENPPREVCSKTQAFGTVGDYVQGNAADPTSPFYRYIIFNNLRSGPNGENPAGSTTVGGVSTDISCLRVDGTRATLGYPSGFSLFIDFPDGPTAPGIYEEGPSLTDPTDCPAFQDNGQGFQIQGDVTIHDAP